MIDINEMTWNDLDRFEHAIRSRRDQLRAERKAKEDAEIEAITDPVDEKLPKIWRGVIIGHATDHGWYAHKDGASAFLHPIGKTGQFKVSIRNNSGFEVEQRWAASAFLSAINLLIELSIMKGNDQK